MPLYAIYALASTALLTAIANVVVKVVPKRHPHLRLVLGCFTALAAGALLGDAFLYLLPKAAHAGWTIPISISVVVGVLLMFMLERSITWRELKNHQRRSRRKHAAVSNMFGFTAQSFVDGLVIAGSYVIAIPVGIATTIAVIIHQIPQEISNYVILRRAGVGAVLANRINILAVFTAFLGAAISLILPILFKLSIILTASFTAGVFLYVALAQLVPDMMRDRNRVSIIAQTTIFLIGIGLIALVKYFKIILGAMD